MDGHGTHNDYRSYSVFIPNPSLPTVHSFYHSRIIHRIYYKYLNDICSSVLTYQISFRFTVRYSLRPPDYNPMPYTRHNNSPDVHYSDHWSIQFQTLAGVVLISIYFEWQQTADVERHADGTVLCYSTAAPNS